MGEGVLGVIYQHDRERLVDAFRLVTKESTALWHSQVGRSFSPAQFYILDRLANVGPQKVADLAAALQITSGAITARSDKLIKEGYAVRSRSTEDRRIVYLTITSEGEAKLKAISEQWEKLIERFFDSFTEEEIKEQISHYERIRENIKRMAEE